MEKSFEVIVVGAGPAGSILAKDCAQAGLDTLILEKRPRVGIPVLCAEGIDTQGLEDHSPPRPSWIASRIEGGRLYGPNGEAAEVKHPRAGYILERAIFDRDLAALATRAGATIWVGAEALGMDVGEKGVEVRVKRAGREMRVKGQVVVGADGIGSKVGRWGGLRTRLAPCDLVSCCQYLLAYKGIPSEFVEFHIGNLLAPGGYAWVFPKGDGLANVGLAISPNKSQKGPKHFLDLFVQRVFPGAEVLGITWGAVSTSKPLSPSFARRLLVVGDAARLTDPLSGAGISNALRSGAWAAETIKEAFGRGDFSANSLRGYEKKWKKGIGRELYFRYRAKEVFLKLTDKELNEVTGIAKEMFAGRSVKSIEVKKIVKGIVRSSPRLLRLAKHLISI